MHKQVLILHAQNTYNNGSFMMLINLIWYYVKHIPEQVRITFWVELDGVENYERLMNAFPGKFLSGGRVEIKELPLKITSIDNSFFLLKAMRLFAKYYRHPAHFRKLGIDTVILLGGDDISEYYKKWMIVSDLYRIRCYSRKIPTILAGQTIGPFKGLREKVAARCLSKTHIYTRDEISAFYLKDSLSLPEQQVQLSADLCFPDLPLQAEDTATLKSYELAPEDYITLVPGGFYTLYTRDREEYINSWTHLLKILLDAAAYKRMKIVLLPHVTRPEDDRKMIRAICQSLSFAGNYSGRLCTIDEELMPHELRTILGNGRLTISSRMHAALSTFQMKKPAVALGYSVKYEGVIGRSIQLPRLLVHCSEKLLTDQEAFSLEVLSKTSYIEKNYSQLISHLETRIPHLKTMAEDQIRELSLRGTKV